MRIFVGGFGCENNTFSPIPTAEVDFRTLCWIEADAPISGYQPATLLIQAVQEQAAREDWTVTRGLFAGAQPGGLVARDAYEHIREHLLNDLRRAGRVDAVLLQLHGAMVAHGYPDCEADILARVRTQVGADVFVGALLDPHCHLSAAMLREASALIMFKEYPHSDILDRARELVRLCARSVFGEIRPVMAMADTGILDIIHTTRPPGSDLVRELRELESQPGILSVSVAHGFPWADVPDVGTRTLVVADADMALAEHASAALASRVREGRGTWASPVLSLGDLQQALGRSEGTLRPIVIADTADNPGGGAPSDATFLLEALRALGETDIAAAILWDPGALQIARAAGVGAEIDVRVGGKVCRQSGQPMDLRVRVERIVESSAQQFAGAPWPTGPLAWLRSTDGMDLVVGERRVQCFTPEPFECLGIPVANKRIVVVKSSQHFRAAFDRVAGQVLYVDTPGVCTMQYRDLPYAHRPRPLWPFETIAGR